jgi:oligoendopeptidase F
MQTNIPDDGVVIIMAPLELEKLRQDVEAFQGAINEEFYQNYAGIKDDLSSAPIYDKYAHLFSLEAIDATEKACEEHPTGEDARWTKYLRAFSMLGYIDNAVKQWIDKAQTFETQSTIDFEGENIPYRFIPIKIRNEPDSDRRGRLFAAKLEETKKLNEVLMQKTMASHDLAVELGFKNYRDFCSTVKGLDYKALEEQMEELLRRTERLYLDQMDQVLIARAGRSLEEAWSYDVPYAFRGDEFNKYFDKDKIVDAFFSTLKGMGIEPGKYGNIMIDTEVRPKKTPRAFCAVVKVPDDVRLVIRPVGGWRDYDAFFHEGGHAWHFGNTSRDHPPEYKYLGDRSVTEAFAFLFNYLPSNKLWLEKTLGMKENGDYVRFTLVNKLMFLRRYASKLIYEMKLHQARVSEELGSVYRTCLQKGLKFKHTDLHYLEDVDDAFYCAEYLRAWILEGQLREALTDKFGETWFENEKAGEYLKELWSYGQKYTAEELVETIGYVDLDFEPTVQEIERGLQD